MVLLVVVLNVVGVAHVHCLENTFTIHNLSEFVQFSDDVNNGTNYLGTTVFLDSGIEFTQELSKEFRLTGVKETVDFIRTFDGKGHVISGLQINSSSLEFVGLFGVSYGIAIKNLVMDSSCSVTSHYSGEYKYPHIGGIIGRFSAKNSSSSIENVVNMADVVYKGNWIFQLRIGGITGHAQGKEYDLVIKNCVNYGSVIYSGKSN